MIVWNAINQSIGILHFHYSKLILSEKKQIYFRWAKVLRWASTCGQIFFDSVPLNSAKIPISRKYSSTRKNINYNIQIEIIHCTKLEVIIKYDRAVME